MSKICNRCLLHLPATEYSDAEYRKPLGMCRTCEKLPPLAHVEDAIEKMMKQTYGNVCVGCSR